MSHSPNAAAPPSLPAGTARTRLLAGGLTLSCALTACSAAPPTRRLPTDEQFPAALVRLSPLVQDSVFAGTGRDTWDRRIRERGFVLFGQGEYRLYYTGYNDAAGDREQTRWPSLGLASSSDGVRWTRQRETPLISSVWTEDVHVSRDGDEYYVLAEGASDIAHALTSRDGLTFTDLGPLDIRRADGTPIASGPYGTPTLWQESDRSYLFYERDDNGIWLATSADRKVWTNVDDEPVIPRGPDGYDADAVALNQIIRYDGQYYALYHGTADRHRDLPWTTSIARSEDLIHWVKYSGNPVLKCDCSSAVYVPDGPRPLLFTMHPEVRVWSASTASGTP